MAFDDVRYGSLGGLNVYFMYQYIIVVVLKAKHVLLRSYFADTRWNLGGIGLGGCLSSVARSKKREKPD